MEAVHTDMNKIVGSLPLKKEKPIMVTEITSTEKKQ